MPKYLGSGSHDHDGIKYRFVVMEKFGSDIWKIFLENNKCFPADTVFKLGIQIVSSRDIKIKYNFIIIFLL